MKRVLLTNSEAAAAQSAAMEAENHVKHGASSKSLMSRGNFLKTCFVLLAAGVIIFASCSTEGNSKSERWEYKVLSEILDSNNDDGVVNIIHYRNGSAYIRGSLEDTLNSLGAEGWELIILDQENNHSTILTFKRRLP